MVSCEAHNNFDEQERLCTEPHTDKKLYAFLRICVLVTACVTSQTNVIDKSHQGVICGINRCMRRYLGG